MGEDLNREARLLQARVNGQSGLLTRAQALDAGISPDRLRWKVKSGRWLTMQPGVYLTEPGRRGWEVQAVAALLFVGRPSALSGISAAHAWGLVRDPGAAIEVLVPYGRRQSARPGIVTRRSRHFDTRVDPDAWPHRTTVEHTVLDLARERDLDGAIALVARACQRRMTDELALLAALAERPTQSGRALLVEALSDMPRGAHSVAEVRYVRDVERAHGLPTGIGQEPGPRGTHRDRAYAELRLIVEVDGRRGHQGWLGQQADGRRDRRSAAGGWLTVRVLWLDVANTPCELALELGAICQSRGWTGQLRACRRGDCPVLHVA